MQKRRVLSNHEKNKGKKNGGKYYCVKTIACPEVLVLCQQSLRSRTQQLRKARRKTFRSIALSLRTTSPTQYLRFVEPNKPEMKYYRTLMEKVFTL